MDRDDYISKLFIKNQDKLEQTPSADFWSKLETQLDKQMPVVPNNSSGGRPNIISMSRYLAAASVLIAVFGSVYLFNWAKMPGDQAIAIVMEEPLALLTDAPEPYLDREVMPTNITITAAQSEEVKKQEAKIVTAVNNSPNMSNSNAKLQLKDISIANPGSSTIIIEPEVSTKLNSLASGTGADLYKNDVVLQQENSMNYANSIPQISNSADNNSYADVVLNKSRKENANILEDLKGDEVLDRRASSRGGLMPSQSKSKSTPKIKSPMASAHARLQPFGFLLGRWVDDNEKEGTSYETWSIKDANTLIGKGYKLSKNNERIFEEIMRIEFRNNQVFLVISLDENNSTIDYMMTKFDSERFIFEQKESTNYPDKVVLQRNLDGYQTIILNDSDFLTSDQQRYLENRNRVSNVRSIRTMRYDE